MSIELPDQVLRDLHLTGEQARVDFAVGLYTGRKVSLGRAAKIAGLPYATFMHELGQRGISINYTLADIEHDMQMVDELAGKATVG